MLVCLFVCLGWRPGPRPRDRFRQRYPLRDLAYAKLPGEALPRFLWDWGKGREREGRGGSTNEATIHIRYVPAPRGSPEGGWEGG